MPHDRLDILICADVDPTSMLRSSGCGSGSGIAPGGCAVGGAERALAGEAEALAAHGHRVTVLARAVGLPAADEADVRGLRLFRVPAPAGRGPASLVRTLLAFRRAARSVCARSRPDVILSHQCMSGLGLLGAECLREAAVVARFHSPWPEEYLARADRSAHGAADLPRRGHCAARRVLERRYLRKAARVAPLSRYMARRVRMAYDLSEDAVRVVPGGVDVERFSPDRRDQGSGGPYGDARGRTVLLTVRNLEPRMGVSNLLEAMVLVHLQRADVLCVVGGTGPLLDGLRRQATALGLDEAVRFTGYIAEDRLAAHYACADLFVLPTADLEGFGLVTVESLACGTPVAGTPVGGTPEILAGLDAVMVAGGADPVSIASAVMRNVDRCRDPQLRARCREYAETRYAWPVVAARMAEVLHEAAALGGVRHG